MDRTLLHEQGSGMDSKKKYRFNYRLRLFLPITILIWVTIAVMATYSFQREAQYRLQTVKSDIQLINNRILDMYQNDRPIYPFIQFIEHYYNSAELQGIRVSIYENNDLNDPTMVVGKPLTVALEDINVNDKKYVCYLENTDSVTGVTVRSALPYSVSVSRWLNVDSGFWIFIIIMGLSATIITYFTASHLARSVTLLRDFTEKALNDDEFVAEDNFPNDELGDISKQIVSIYNERNAAMEAHEREHRIALRAAEEKARLKRQLTDNVNHELKTPVGIVKGYVDTLVENPNLDEESRKHFLKKTQQQVGRLCSMLDDLSTLTRLDAASGIITTREINFTELLENLADEIDESGIGGDLTFVYDVPENCVVKGSESLLNAAILNLAKNAVAYSEGSEMGVLYTDENDNFYSFVFYDNGKGVPEESVPKLFDRFYRVDKGRVRKNGGGTGLGLSIVKSTVISMGGSISVKNREEGGLEFSFSLPKWKGEQ